MHVAGHSLYATCLWVQPVMFGQALYAWTGIVCMDVHHLQGPCGCSCISSVSPELGILQGLADSAVGMCVQNELDSIRSELASLRQSIGKNRSADNGMSDNVRNGTRAEAMPGGNMV